MRFIKTGPDVPDLLIQANEDGKVVFFCGAGIHDLSFIYPPKQRQDEVFGDAHRVFVNLVTPGVRVINPTVGVHLRAAGIHLSL